MRLNLASFFSIFAIGLIPAFAEAALPVITNYVPTAPVIVLPKSPVTLSVQVMSDTPATYQWYSSGAAVGGAVASSYTINSLVFASMFYVKVTNKSGSVRSPLFIVNTGTLPNYTMVSQSHISLSPGGALGLKVVTPPSDYSDFAWLKDGVWNRAWNGSGMQIPSVTVTDAGEYRVRVHNRYGSVISSPILFTVVNGSAQPPSIVAQPASSVKMIAGLANSIAVNVIGDGPVSGRWYLNGAPLSGQTNFSLSWPELHYADAGEYTFEATSPYGTVSTSAINVVPGGHPTIVQYPPNYVYAYVNQPVVLATSTELSSPAPLRHFWLKDNKGVPGGISPTLSILAPSTPQTAQYKLRVISDIYSTFGYPINLVTLAANAPAITGIDGRYTYEAGESLILKANTMGSGLTYSWLKNQVPIPNANSAQLVIPNVSASDSGNYSLQLTNGFGVASRVISIKVFARSSAAVNAGNLAVLVNDNDPYSVAVGAYYQSKRKIPAQNVIHLQVPTFFNRSTFAPFKAIIDAQLPAHIQALAIAWASPSTVECNSLTSALSRGFDETGCASTCGLGQLGRNPYFDSDSNQPFTDIRFRPSMMLAARSVDAAKMLIDRGIAADGTRPTSSAYLMETSDPVRSLRAQLVASDISWPVGLRDSKNITTKIIPGDNLLGRRDIMFYFTGLANVPSLDQSNYLPGAVADHLTSYGGTYSSSQMSALEWIGAGATGSFGTVSEPCAWAEKFPDPRVMIKHYGHGDTLIEAYWKSVQYTFQGLFIGDPLAAPYR